MSKFTRLAGFIWASPLTLLALLYVSLFTFIGWYRHLGRFDDAWVWTPRPDSPEWIAKRWLHWGAHTLGNVVVTTAGVQTDRGKVALRHEQEHVHQCMVLGVFYPILYSLSWLALSFCRSAHPVYDNPFEVDARRAAGQVVDVIGALKHAIAVGKLKPPVRH